MNKTTSNRMPDIAYRYGSFLFVLLVGAMITFVGFDDSLFSVLGPNSSLWFVFLSVLLGPLAFIACVLSLISEMKIYKRGDSGLFGPVAIAFYTIALFISAYVIYLCF